MVHNTIHEAFTNHNWVLANTIGNVMKEVFFGAPVDQVGPSYFNGYNPLVVGSSVLSSCQQPNDGQYQQSPVQQLPGGQAQDQTLQAARGKVKPYQWQGQGQMTGATASTAVTKCPCHIDSSAAYYTKPSVFSPAANLTNHSTGCATAGSGKIQYFLPNASVGP